MQANGCGKVGRWEGGVLGKKKSCEGDLNLSSPVAKHTHTHRKRGQVRVVGNRERSTGTSSVYKDIS